MPIKNYTTKKEAGETVSEIQKKLSMAGALRTAIEWDGFGIPASIHFLLEAGDTGPIPFRITAQPEPILALLQSDKSVDRRYKTKEQAARIAWRLILNYVEIIIAFAEMEQAPLPKLFFGFALVREGVDTFSDYTSSNLLT